MSAKARTAWRGLRRAADLVPVTPLGLAVATSAALALRFVAEREMDYVLAVACAAVLGMQAVAIVLVVGGAVRVKLASRGHRGPSERTVEADRSLPTGFDLPALSFVPLLQVRWSWEAPEAELSLHRERMRLHEHAAVRRRGSIDEIRRRIVVEDAFGLARLAIRHRERCRLKVLPNSGALRRMPLLASMAGGDEVPHPMGLEDGDRLELRRYVPGDPARLVHWKVFGRTRKLMVRVPERALSRSRRTVAYLVGGPDDEASAAAARVAIETGALGPEWIFGADGTEGDCDDVGAAIERVIRSAGVGDGGGRALRAFVDRAERVGPAALVLFVPARPGPWLDRVLAVLRGRGRRARVVIGVDGVDAAAVAPWWVRALVREAARSGTPIGDLERVLAAFASVRCDVVVLDRRSGRRIGDAHRGALRAMASSRTARRAA